MGKLRAGLDGRALAPPSPAPRSHPGRRPSWRHAAGRAVPAPGLGCGRGGGGHVAGRETPPGHTAGPVPVRRPLQAHGGSHCALPAPGANSTATAVGSRLQTRAHQPARSLLAQLLVGLPALARTVNLFHDPLAPVPPSAGQLAPTSRQGRWAVPWPRGPRGAGLGQLGAPPTTAGSAHHPCGPAHPFQLLPFLLACSLQPAARAQARNGVGAPLGRPAPPLPRGRPENPERGSTAPPGRAAALGMLSSRGRFFSRK